MSGVPHELVVEFIDTVARNPKKADAMLAEHPELLNARWIHEETVLHFLAVEGFTEGVRFLATRGADVNAVNEFGDTALVDVAVLGLTEIADILLSHGANPDAQSEVRENPLHAAARAGHADLVRRLFKAGANPRYRTDLEESIFDDAVASGGLHLTAVTLIAPHLTAENVDRVIAAATHRTERDIEELVAELRPQPPVQSSVRKLPQTALGDSHRTPGVLADLAMTNVEAGTRRAVDAVSQASDGARAHAPVPPVERPVIRPLAPEQYLVKFTASRATHEKLKEAQALLRHQVPSGDVAEIFDRALTQLLVTLRKARHAATIRPRSTHRTANTGRHVAAAVKREVWGRDGGRCAFVGAAGRCTERGFLEYHHVIPFADGGQTDASNLQLRCRAHNRFDAERWSGPREEDLVREISPNYGGWWSPPAMEFGTLDSGCQLESDSVQTEYEQLG